MSMKLGAISRHNALSGTDAGSGCIEEIVPAAHEGRVELLLIKSGVEVPGDYDAAGRKVSLAGADSPDNMDLVDFAAAHTIMAGGRVLCYTPGELTASEPAAAIFKHQGGR
jgi:hypothetical protein